MSREIHVQFCEGAGGQFPRATRLVVCFEREDDARRVQAVLPERFQKYGLTLHPEKTRLLRFERPAKRGALPASVSGSVRSFDFLGFTHHWAKARSGSWVVLRRTMRSRFTRTLGAIAEWCRQHMHAPLAYQAKMLGMKLRGHDAYFGITGNSGMIWKLRHFVKLIWWKHLRRRSQRILNANTFYKVILARYPLPPARAVHSTLRKAKL